MMKSGKQNKEGTFRGMNRGHMRWTLWWTHRRNTSRKTEEICDTGRWSGEAHREEKRIGRRKKKRLKTKQAFALALTPLGCVVKELAHIMSSSRYERWSLGNVLYLLLAPSLKNVAEQIQCFSIKCANFSTSTECFCYTLTIKLLIRVVYIVFCWPLYSL